MNESCIKMQFSFFFMVFNLKLLKINNENSFINRCDETPLIV